MADNIENRVAKNTAMLYARVIVLAGVSLYTVRVVLNVLGVENFGVYNAVAGLTALCIFLPGTLASATQRFFSFSIGEGDEKGRGETFCVSVVLYLGMACFALILLETAGLYFVSNHLEIPKEKFESAIILYQLTVASFICSIFTAPFIALIIAHERMKFYTLISIADAVIKLTLVFLLQYFPYDTLWGYGAVLLVSSATTTGIYILVCIKKFEECQFVKWNFEYSLAKKMLMFTGWTLFGQLSTVARNQSVTLLLNQYFGPIVVAARSIAVTTGAQINVFAVGFNTSLYAPIVKSYAVGNLTQMYDLVFVGSRLTFYLMWIFALPIYVHMDFVLSVWLGDPPEGTVYFTKFVLLESIILAASLPLTTAARAPGNMALYEGVMGVMQISIFFISWALLWSGYEAYVVFVTAVVVSFIMFFVRLFIVGWLTGLSVIEYFKKVLTKAFGVAVLSIFFSLVIESSIADGKLFDFMSLLFSFVLCVLCVYTVGIDRVWREKINSVVARIFSVR